MSAGSISTDRQDRAGSPSTANTVASAMIGPRGGVDVSREAGPSALMTRGAAQRRERLTSTRGLVLTGLAFAVAFAALSPSNDAFRARPDVVGSGEPVIGDAGAVDDLRLAYLKARGASGELSAEEAFAAIGVLARDGRVEQARELLDASPSLVLSEANRLELDVLIADGKVRRAADSSGTEAAQIALAALLREQFRQPGITDSRMLKTGLTRAVRAGDTRLAAALGRRLANADPAHAADHFASCARLLRDIGAAEESADCFERARMASAGREQRFGLTLELLPMLPALGSDERRRELVEELVQDKLATVRELKLLAPALLTMERPDAAALVYARLAENEPASRGEWLLAAARWSEAAGRPAQAAVYLDQMTPAEVGPDSAKSHEQRIEALLIGAGRSKDALDRMARRVAVSPADPQIVGPAVQLAQAQSELTLALAWNSALLEARPDDAEALIRQASLALAVGDPALARRAAQATLAIDPDDVSALEKIARLAEWDGDPEAALRHHRRLMTLRGSDDDLQSVARLAELVRRPAIAADALTRLAERRLPDRDRLRSIVRLHELDGRPDVAASVLERVLTRYGLRGDILRELAALHVRHLRYADALSAWQRLATRFGRTADETLARVEMNWRLGNEDRAAVLAQELPALGFGGVISAWQVSLLAEIGWRYRLPAVAALATPRLSSIEDASQRAIYGRRVIDDRLASGDRSGALEQAESLWREEGTPLYALAAIRIAIETGDADKAQRLLDETAEVDALRSSPEYWGLLASTELRRGDPAAARRAYETALGIDANSIDAISGLLWLHIGEQDNDAIASLLRAERERAVKEARLWAAFAVGHVTIGDATGSLPWFQRVFDAPQSDYGLLLTFADALEDAGHVDDAREVRNHAVTELRPRLLSGVGEDRDLLLRQYGGVLARHGGADANEAWMRYVLNMDADQNGDALFWREDMAISWLMATERHEHARLIMAKLHERRLAAPAWQDLALALRADDVASVEAMLASGTGLSAGNRMLALRQIGRDSEAWALALRTLDNPATRADRDIAQSQYVSLRQYRPSYASTVAGRVSGGGVGIVETGFALRHTLGTAGIGLGVDLLREQVDAASFDPEANDTRSRLALTLFRDSTRQGFGLGAGLIDDGEAGRLWATARSARRSHDGRREAQLNLAWREYGSEQPVLRLSTVSSRVGASLESAIGRHGFARLSGEANEIETRVTERRLARGLASRTELGWRNNAGSLRWSSSVAFATADNERMATAGDDLGLPAGVSIDQVIAGSNRTLSLNGSISRGTVGDNWPDGVSPRWFVNGGVSRAMPDGALGLQLDAGAGFRILGNDELGIGVAREARLSGTRTEPDSTRIGIEYRHHF